MVINDVKMSINDILDIYSKGCIPASRLLAAANGFFRGDTGSVAAMATCAWVFKPASGREQFVRGEGRHFALVPARHFRLGEQAVQRIGERPDFTRRFDHVDRAHVIRTASLEFARHRRQGADRVRCRPGRPDPQKWWI